MIELSRYTPVFRHYKASLRQKIREGQSGEDQHRTAAISFLDTFAHLFTKADPSNGTVSTREQYHIESVNRRTDLTFLFNGADVIGHVERKGVGTDLSAHVISDQISDYASDCNNILVTNGKEFQIVRDGKVAGQKVSIDEPGNGIYNLLHNFINQSPPSKFVAKNFAGSLVEVCKDLKKRLTPLAKSLEEDSNLSQVYNGYNKSRGYEVEPEKFADELAQTICHASLMAKMRGGGGENNGSKFVDVH